MRRAGLALLAALAQAPAEASAPLSQRVVSYEIDARLDAARKVVDGREVLVYRNLTGRPLDRFPFHLYLEAFRPDSTYVQERLRDDPRFEWDERHRGGTEIKSLVVAGMGDLTSQLQFRPAGEGSPADRTVFEVRLPRPVPAGGAVEFRIEFQSRLPQLLARTGYDRDFVMGAQWFPKVGVFWNGAWNCRAYHRSSEFFSDFGTYRVSLTLPQAYVVGGVGEVVATADHPDGTKTVTFAADDVHDFAWAADPRFRVVEKSWTGGASPVRIRLLLQPDHADQAPRFLAALTGAMGRLERWYGPYPYPQITVVDAPPGASGMEYPTLVTVRTRSGMPLGVRAPELEVIHEFGHQYWYGMVATNEVEEPWLDEGLTTYTSAKVLDDLYGRSRSYLELLGLTADHATFLRLQFKGLAAPDPVTRRADGFFSHTAYEAISYGRAASVLLTLESLVGEDGVRKALQAYFLRYRFGHPTGEDLLRTFSEATGRDLRPFFEQALGTAPTDYAVADVSAEPVEGQTALWRSTVLVQRPGALVLPVDIEARFEDGEIVRERWDGQDRWIRYEYRRPSPLVSAEVDPGRRVWLDRDFLNNGRRRLSDGHAARKLAYLGLFLRQFLGQLLAWLA